MDCAKFQPRCLTKLVSATSSSSSLHLHDYAGGWSMWWSYQQPTTSKLVWNTLVSLYFDWFLFSYCFTLLCVCGGGCVCVCLFRATLKAYGGSQARGRIGAVATGLYQSHSNAGSEPLSGTYTTAHGSTGSLTHWLRPGINPTSSWILVGFVNHWDATETSFYTVYRTFFLLHCLISFLSLHDLKKK